MLTIEDLRNSKRRSGFDQVTYASSSTSPSSKPYQARKEGPRRTTTGKGSQTLFKGPRRTTAEEAAQDYCDYINDLGISAPARLNTPGHERRNPNKQYDEEVAAALGVLRDHRAQRRGRQGYVYCIGEGPTGGWAVKVGYSVKPEARAGELQTGNPRTLHLLGKFEGTEADERALHAKYVKYNLIGEWFVATPELLGEFGLNAAGQPKERTLAAA